MTEPWDELADVDFAAIRERVSWAGRDIEQMKLLVAAYENSRPFHVFLTKSEDGRTITETVTLTADPPLQVGFALGDISHHLRAALDNLVGAVAVGGPTRQTAFPIADTPARFAEKASSSLRSVPAWAVDAIQSVQPI